MNAGDVSREKVGYLFSEKGEMLWAIQYTFENRQGKWVINGSDPSRSTNIALNPYSCRNTLSLKIRFIFYELSLILGDS